MARAAEVELTIEDFQTVADKAPLLADLKYVTSETRSLKADSLKNHCPDLRENT